MAEDRIYPYRTEGREAPEEVYDDRSRQCPVCRQDFPGFRLFWGHAIDEHGWAWRDGKLKPPDDEQIGMGRSALYVVAIWPVPHVHRQTIHALASVNDGGGTRSHTRVAESLRKAERAGLLVRDGVWVRALDQAAIYARAVGDIQTPRHEKFLALREAIPVVSAQIAAERNEAVAAQRRRELSVIRSLMRPYDGPMSGRRSPVRVVAAGRI